MNYAMWIVMFISGLNVPKQEKAELTWCVFGERRMEAREVLMKRLDACLDLLYPKEEIKI